MQAACILTKDKGDDCRVWWSKQCRLYRRQLSLSAENLFSPFERLADLWRRHLTPAPLTSQPLRPIVGPPAGKCHSAIKGEKKEERRATLDGVISASLCSMHAAVVCVRLSAVNLSTPRVEEERREIIIC